jgi:hypothetical protein
MDMGSKFNENLQANESATIVQKLWNYCNVLRYVWGLTICEI